MTHHIARPSGNEPSAPASIQILPATAERWPDLEALFGDHRTSCWCMFWRLKRADFQRLKGEEKKALFRGLTLNNEIQGVLAYENGQAVGWCAIAPRQITWRWKIPAP